jgi:hypothetical protein
MMLSNQKVRRKLVMRIGDTIRTPRPERQPRREGLLVELATMSLQPPLRLSDDGSSKACSSSIGDAAATT